MQVMFGFSNKTLEAEVNTNTCSLIENGIEIQPTIEHFHCNISSIDKIAAKNKGFTIHEERGTVVEYSNTKSSLQHGHRPSPVLQGSHILQQYIRGARDQRD